MSYFFKSCCLLSGKRLGWTHTSFTASTEGALNCRVLPSQAPALPSQVSGVHPVFQSPPDAVWPHSSKQRQVCRGSTTTALPVQRPSQGQRVTAHDVPVSLGEVNRDCVLPAASTCEPGKWALRYTTKFGSSAWLCTCFRELSFTAMCDPRKQLWKETLLSPAPFHGAGVAALVSLGTVAMESRVPVHVLIV